jgi:hypothetical protein
MVVSKCSTRKIGRQQQDIGVAGGRKEGRRTESHRKRKEKKKEEEEGRLQDVTVRVHFGTCCFSSTWRPETRSTHPALQRVPGFDPNNPLSSTKINA